MKKIFEIRGWTFSSRSTPKGKKRAKVSSENVAGSLPSSLPVKWCVRPGGMNDDS